MGWLGVPSGGSEGKVQSGASLGLADHTWVHVGPPWLLLWVLVSWQMAQSFGMARLHHKKGLIPNSVGGFSCHRFPGHSVGLFNEMTDSRLLDFSGKQDALSFAVRGRDGLQLQEIQQHLDLGHDL